MFDALHDRPLVLFGELHGTAEAPAHVAAALAAVAPHGAVALAIEWPDSLQPAVDEFLVTGDRAALLATPDPFWTWRDGRSSVAMLALLERARTLRIAVTCFDGDFPSAETREAGMAARLLAALAPGRTTLALCGNLHARTTPPWMGSHLRAHVPDLISLDLHHAGGTAWCCLADHEPGIQHFAATAADTDAAADGFDGFHTVGSIRASPPAA